MGTVFRRSNRQTISSLPFGTGHEQAADLHRKARPVGRRRAPARRRYQAPGRGGKAALCPARLERHPRLRAGKNADGAGIPVGAERRLQCRRRHHDARFHRRPGLCLVHPRRRHGACRDDRLAQSHRRCRPENLPHLAVGARRRLDSRRRIFQRRHAVSFRAAPAAAQGAAQARRTRLRQRHRRGDRVVSVSRRRGAFERGQYRRARHPRPSDQNLAGRARLSLPLRIQHGFDAAGVRCARRCLRDARIWPAFHRKRMGPRTSRVHVCPSCRARRRRQRAAVSHRDAAGVPAARLFRHLHGSPGVQGLLSERLAPASVAGRCVERRQSVDAEKIRRTVVAARPVVSRRPSAIRGAERGVRHAHRQRLSPLQAELAGARSRRLGLRPSRRHDPRARRRGRSGDAI